MVAAIRPGWSKHTSGIPIDAVVRIAAVQGGRQDITTSRNRVALIRPGSLQPKPEDEHEVHFVYGSEATNKDLHDRTVQPLLMKLLDGFNAAIVVVGATGSGKSSTLEGPRGQDLHHADGSGLVHITADELFDMLHSKAVAVGQEVAKRRRMPTAKGFDFFLECSYVELYNEQCSDLLTRGAKAALPVVEDPLNGYEVMGLTTKVAKTAEELRVAFNWGRQNRNYGSTELGSAHDRSASLFTITVAQYTPAMTLGQEDVVLVSKLVFVDTPGAERLAMDPDVLRLREGVAINKSLLSFASVVRQLATDSSSFVNYEESVLTRLLSDALGGNCVTAFIGTIRQGQTEQSSSTLRVLTNAHAVRNYPLINHNRARGYLFKLRHRTLSVIGERNTLYEQLHDVPADGDPTSVGLNMAKIRDMERRLIEEREEKAELVKDKEALQLRLAGFKDSTTKELREKAELQEALIRSEEARLEVSRHLIDFQLEYNEAKAGWEGERYCLEQRIMELEAKQLETFVRSEDHAAVLDERNKFHDDFSNFRARAMHLDREVSLLKDQLNLLEKERKTLRSTLDSERQQHDRDRHDLERYKLIADTLEADARGDPAALVHLSNQLSDVKQRLDQEKRVSEQLRQELAAATGKAPQSFGMPAGGAFPQQAAPQAMMPQANPMAMSATNPLQVPVPVPMQVPVYQYAAAPAPLQLDAGGRRAEDPEKSLMQATIAVKDRKLQEQQVELTDLQREVDRLRIAHTTAQTALDEARVAYRKKMELWSREITDVGRVAGLMQQDPHNPLRLTPESLAEKLALLVTDIIQEYEGREEDIIRDLDRLQARHSELRRKFRAIYLTYRQLRYKVEDTWPIGTGDQPPRCPREDDVVGAAPEELFRAEEESDRKALTRLREHVAKLQSELSRARVFSAKGGPVALIRESKATAAEQQPQPPSQVAAKLENMRLRNELQTLRAQLESKGSSFDSRVVEELRARNAQLQARLAECERADRTRTQMGTEISELKAQVEKFKSMKWEDPQKVAAAAAGLRKQVKEFTLNTQMDLERRAQAAEARAVMAEEQLEGLQRYMSEASVTYQREIVRLRGILANMEQKQQQQQQQQHSQQQRGGANPVPNTGDTATPAAGQQIWKNLSRVMTNRNSVLQQAPPAASERKDASAGGG